MLSPNLIGVLCVFKLLCSKYCIADVFSEAHLKPLGSHRTPDAIEERNDIPSPFEFWNKYVKVSKPVVFRGAGKLSKAFMLWTDQYLSENYGNLEVRIERKLETSGVVPVGAKGLGRDTIENFIGHYHKTNSYIVSELPTPLWGDVSVPPCLTCGTFADRLVEVDLWMSGGGSKSKLHKDAYNAINCLYNGTKQWKIIDYKHENMIYKAWEPEREIGGFSLIDVDAVDLKKYPKIAQVPWSYVEINAGDCLFLPKSHYHQVNSFGSQNVAVAILFSRFDNVVDYDNSGCDSSLLQHYVPLSHLDVDWKYPGYGDMTMGNAAVESVRDFMKDHLNNNGRLTLKEMKLLVKSISAGAAESETIATKIFKHVAKENATFINSEDLSSLSKDELRTLVLLVERYEPSNTYTYEYSLVNSEDIRHLIHQLIEQDKKVIRNKFVERYTKNLGGTEKYALQIFRGLLPKDETMATRNEVSKRLDIMLKPYVEYSKKAGTFNEADDEELPEYEDNFRDEL